MGSIFQKEIKVLISIFKYTGVYKLPLLEDYWNRNGRETNHEITKFIGFLIFYQLKSFINICDSLVKMKSHFNKLEPHFYSVFEVSKHLGILGKNLRVDSDEINVIV